jgi:transposase
MWEKVLVPCLNADDVVVMDNLGSHKGKAVRALIRSAGAKRFFLPKYSPDLNPIEQVFASLNTSCARPKRAPTTTSAPPSARRWQLSPRRNAPATSKTQDTCQPKFIPL